MSKPINRKKQRTWYICVGIFIYLGILYFACHLGQFNPGEDIYQAFLSTIDHIKHKPFNILPTDKEFLQTAAIIGFMAPLLLYAEYLRRRDLRPMEENGSAKWNEDIKSYNEHYAEMSFAWPKLFYKFPLKFIRLPLVKIHNILIKTPIIKIPYKSIYKTITKFFGRVDKTPGSKNMIFTNEIYMSMNGRKTRRNNNILVIGGSGAGKSRFVVKPNLLQANCSYVITDPSGELLETMGQTLKDMGYDVRVFNLVQMDHSCCYNPFHYIRDQNGVLIMINALIRNTTPKGSNTSDPFWEKAETALLQACAFYLVSECSEEDRNFANVMKLLQCASAVEGQENVDSALDILFKDLEAKDPEHIAVRSYKVFKSAGGGKTAQSILISCQTRLQHFNLTSIKNLTNIDTINLGDIGDKPVALFCTTPTADTSFNFLVALLYTQLFETLYYHAETECKGKRLPYHVRFLLDEFANIGTIPDFDKKLATMRKYEISCTIIIQALSQLKTLYKDEWEVIVGNCDSFLFLGGSDITTLDYVSKKLGKETIRSINNSRNFGKQGSHSMSYNKTGRELLTSDELSGLDNDYCVLFIRGLRPFYSRKYKLESHPNYHLSGDCDDSKLFYITKEFHTGSHIVPIKEETRATRVMKDAEMADTREAERQYQLNKRRPIKYSAKGKELAKSEPMENEFTTLKGVDDIRRMTAEQREAFQRQMAEYDLQKTVIDERDVDISNYEDPELEMFDLMTDTYGVVATPEEYDIYESSSDNEQEH